jgi:hypothetical protein
MWLMPHPRMCLTPKVLTRDWWYKRWVAWARIWVRMEVSKGKQQAHICCRILLSVLFGFTYKCCQVALHELCFAVIDLIDKLCCSKPFIAFQYESFCVLNNYLTRTWHLQMKEMTVFLMVKDSLYMKQYVGQDYGAWRKVTVILLFVSHVSFSS